VLFIFDFMQQSLATINLHLCVSVSVLFSLGLTLIMVLRCLKTTLEQSWFWDLQCGSRKVSVLEKWSLMVNKKIGFFCR